MRQDQESEKHPGIGTERDSNRPSSRPPALSSSTNSTQSGGSGVCINEATLLAARRRSREITQADLEEAVEKVVAGPERKSRRLDEQRKKLLEAAYLGLGFCTYLS